MNKQCPYCHEKKLVPVINNYRQYDAKHELLPSLFFTRVLVRLLNQPSTYIIKISPPTQSHILNPLLIVSLFLLMIDYYIADNFFFWALPIKLLLTTGLMGLYGVMYYCYDSFCRKQLKQWYHSDLCTNCYSILKPKNKVSKQ